MDRFIFRINFAERIVVFERQAYFGTSGEENDDSKNIKIGRNVVPHL